MKQHETDEFKWNTGASSSKLYSTWVQLVNEQCITFTLNVVFLQLRELDYGCLVKQRIQLSTLWTMKLKHFSCLCFSAYRPSSSHKETFNGYTNTVLIDWQRSIISASLCRIDLQGKISIVSLSLCLAGHVTCTDPAMDTNGTYISWTAPNVTCQTGAHRMRGRERFGVNTHTCTHTLKNTLPSG